MQWRVKDDSCPICREKLGEPAEFTAGYWNLVDRSEVTEELDGILKKALTFLSTRISSDGMLSKYVKEETG